MANYNNTTGSSPRYSRNSKMDLEARKRTADGRNSSMRSNVTPMNYSRGTAQRSTSVGSTTRGTVQRTTYGRTNTAAVYGTQRATMNYERTTTPMTGVRRTEAAVNNRNVTAMGHTQNQSQVYQDGNTMRYAGEAPQRRKEVARKTSRKPVAKKKAKTNPGAISFKYSVFLTSVTLMVAGISMSFLNVQSNVNTKASLITALQKNIADLSVENDSAYGAISQNMNMEAVKDRAEEMGMEYADSTQVVEYNAPMEDTVKQYEAIPTSGVLAQSERTSE